jgi:hypothetical protein
VLVTWTNFFALGRFAARFQIAATVAKLAACAMIIFSGLYCYIFKGSLFIEFLAHWKLFFKFLIAKI